MMAGPAIRSRPMRQAVPASARRQRRGRISAPRPAPGAAGPPSTSTSTTGPAVGTPRPGVPPVATAAAPTSTSTSTTGPAIGTRCPVLPAIATAAIPISTLRTTAITPPPSQRSAPARCPASAARVCGWSAADCTGPCWQARRVPPRRSVDRMATDPPATLAAWLRTRSDEQLCALLAARRDVARPAPSDVVALASRLAVPVSVDRALDELDAATLQVLDVVLLAETDGVDAAELPGALPEVPDDVLAAALDRLGTRALLWGDEVLHAPDPVRRAVRYPAGLGRPATELRLAIPGDLAAVLAELPPEERAVLERLAADRPGGHLPDTPAHGGGPPAPPPP